MSVFGRAPDEEGGIHTFRAPSPPRGTPPTPQRAIKDRLLAAATQADVAQHELADARSRYQRAPSVENRRRLLEAAADALGKEITFDELWEKASQEWFGRV